MSAVLDTVSAAESKKLARALRPFEEGAAYLSENYNALIDEYEDERIAIHGARVIGHARTRHALYRKLTRKPQIARQAYVTFLTKQDQTLIL